jgi:hypothetical protein
VKIQWKYRCRFMRWIVPLLIGSGLMGLVAAPSGPLHTFGRGSFHPRQGRAMICGNVVLSDGITPAVHAMVVPLPVSPSSEGTWERWTYTGSDGFYQCVGLVPGEYHLLALPREPVGLEESSQVQGPQRTLDYFQPGVPRLQVVPLHPGLASYLPTFLHVPVTAGTGRPRHAPTLKLPLGGSVSGRVQGAVSGPSTDRVTVTLRADPVASGPRWPGLHVFEVGPDEYYRWDGIEPGTYRMVVQVRSVQDTSTSSTCWGVERRTTGPILGDRRIEVHAGHVTSGVDFNLSSR